MYCFIQRLRHSDSVDGRAEHAHQQHRRVAGPAHRVNSELAATHRREDPQLGAATAADPGCVEGLLPLGWVQPQPTTGGVGGPPREVTCIKLYLLPLSKPLHETKQKFTKF